MNGYDYQKALTARQHLDGQLNENDCVRQELKFLKPGDGILKLMGPVLVQQAFSEVKDNVDKRMELISTEMKLVDDLILALNRKQETHKQNLDKIQQSFHKIQIETNRSTSSK